jgi:hypothetical protein
MFKIFDVIPGFAWALLCVVLLAGLGTATYQLADERADHGKTKVEFSEYKLDVTDKARIAEKERRDTELHSFRNSERVRDEQTRREQVAAAERTSLMRANTRLRDEADRFRAGIARDSASGDLAAVTAKANTAVELFQACRGRYAALGSAAEAVRTQAVGLYEYIRGNRQCSTPFGEAAFEPSK